MRILRITGIALVALLVVLAASVAALYAWFDGEKVKAELSRIMLQEKQRKLVITGLPRLTVWPNVGLALDHVTLSEPASDAEFVALDSARIAVALMPLLSRQMQVKALELDGLKATLVQHKDGQLNVADLLGPRDPQATAAKEPDNAPPGAPLQLDIASIRVRNAQLTWRDDKAGSVSTLSQLNLSSGRVQADANTLRMDSLALSVDAAVGGATIRLQLGSPVAVNLGTHTLDLPQLAGSVEVAHPGMPMKKLTLPMAGSVQANWVQQTAALQLGTQFEQSKVQSKVSVSRFAPLALAFDLEVDQLNVDRYLPPKAPSAKGDAGTQPAPPAKDAVLDFSALKGPQVSGTVRVGALQVAGLKLSQLNAKLNLAGGRLEVAPLSMKLYEGATSGSLVLNATGNALAVRQNLVGVRINPLMQDLLAKDMLDGRGDVALDVSSHGDTVGTLKKALAGSASLRLKDGAIKGINLAQSLREFKSKLGQPNTTQQAKAGEQTDFSELSASLKIAGGVAHNDDLAMKSPFIRLAGSGDIDIGQGQMNYLAKATLVGSAEGQGGKTADQLAGITVPVRVTGPFEGLSYQLEWASLVSDATKARLEEKKQEIKTQVEEKAKDLFKGLLGR